MHSTTKIGNQPDRRRLQARGIERHSERQISASN
jgi:hypothetical protein